MTIYSPIRFGKTIAYMLQNVEYQTTPYLKWLLRTTNFDTVMHRRTLTTTKASSLFLYFVSVGSSIQIVLALLLGGYAIQQSDYSALLLYGALLIITPITWALLVCIPLIVGRLLIANPKEKRLIKASKKIFATTKATKIAVAGSYGKTTFKELLGTVLVEGKNVAITPANKNVAISHAIFAKKLTGNEDVLVIELGEGRPKDVASFTKTIAPDLGIITGIAPAHLDKYPNLQSVATDIFSLAKHLKPQNVYINGDSPLVEEHIQTNNHVYTQKGIDGSVITNVEVALTGTSFVFKTAQTTYKLHSGLVGRHLLGPLAAVVIIAEHLGLSKDQITKGVSKTAPFEHRMQPRQINGGAWLIDDTYNGTIEGMRAGLALLKDLPVTRKIYVTPGLVDQGAESEQIHIELGVAIAKAQPDIVVIMQNSVTSFITSGIDQEGFKGELRIESDPLHFYKNIENFVAAGDVVLMQNDWPDNYA